MSDYALLLLCAGGDRISNMGDVITKKVLEAMFEQYQASLLEAVSFGFEQARIERSEIRAEIVDLKKSINNLTNTLDHFLKRLTTNEEEFTILKAEVNLLKKIVKDKLGVEVLLQGN